MTHAQYEKFRALVIERFGTCTALRMGQIVGEQGAHLPPPDRYSPRLVKLYQRGFDAGIVARESKDRAIYLCSFASGLDDLSLKEQGDPAEVLRVLHKTGRFSCFEASANQIIAGTITALFHGVHKHLIRKIGGEYPWWRVELTGAGRALIGALPEDMK